MKKNLLVLLAGMLVAGTTSAQCAFDSQYAGESGNFFPDSVTFLATQYAVEAVDYAGVVSIKTISDTLAENPANPTGPPIVVSIDAFKIFSVSGEPTGFTYTEGGATFSNGMWNNGGSGTNTTPVEGCLGFAASAASVTAAAPTTGFTDYPVEVLVDARISGSNPDISFLVPNGTWLSSLGSLGLGPLPVNKYVLRVYDEASAPSGTGVTELLNVNEFGVAQSYPNPALNEAIISFTTPQVTKVDFNVYNMLGARVHSEKILSERGVNNIKLNTSQLSSGLYIYTVSNGSKTITKKMNVK